MLLPSEIGSSETIPSEYGSAAVFVGNILSDDLTISMTNTFSVPHGMHYVDDIRTVRIRVESVFKYDEPIPLRFPDEVSVYYVVSGNHQMPREARFFEGQRKKFYCERRDMLGTNVLVLPGRRHATAP